MTWFANCRSQWRSLVGPNPRPCLKTSGPKTAFDTPHRGPVTAGPVCPLRWPGCCGGRSDVPGPRTFLAGRSRSGGPGW